MVFHEPMLLPEPICDQLLTQTRYYSLLNTIFPNPASMKSSNARSSCRQSKTKKQTRSKKRKRTRTNIKKRGA